MTRAELAALLEMWGPLLGLRAAGFRRNLEQVRKRVARRMQEVGARTSAEYVARLAADRAERQVFDGLCRVTISRFFRDRAVFDALRPLVAELAQSSARVRIWSAGCASGEEPYSLAALMESGVPGVEHEILATDAGAALIQRARRGVYRRSTLRELPPEWVERGFDVLRRRVQFAVQDLRREWPDGPFSVIACRNVAFTYFDAATQQRALGEILRRLQPGGYLVIGLEESLPASLPAGPWPLARAAGALPIFRKQVA